LLLSNHRALTDRGVEVKKEYWKWEAQDFPNKGEVIEH
jgi:hypothetical protein